MDWELEKIFFKYEIHFSRILSFWKPRYDKMEYKVNEHDQNCFTSGGKRLNRNKLGMLYSW